MNLLFRLITKKKGATSWRFMYLIQHGIRKPLVEKYYEHLKNNGALTEDQFYDELEKSYVIDHMLDHIGDIYFHLKNVAEKPKKEGGRKKGEKAPTATDRTKDRSSMIAEVRRRIGEAEYIRLAAHIAPKVHKKAKSFKDVFKAPEVVEWMESMKNKGILGENNRPKLKEPEELEAEVEALDIMADPKIQRGESSKAAAQRTTLRKVKLGPRKPPALVIQRSGLGTSSVTAAAKLKQMEVETYYPATASLTIMDFFLLMKELQQGKTLPPGIKRPSLLHLDIPYFLHQKRMGDWDNLEYAFPPAYRRNTSTAVSGDDTDNPASEDTDSSTEFEFLKMILNGVIEILGPTNATAVIWCSLKQAAILLELAIHDKRVTASGNNYAGKVRCGQSSEQNGRLPRINCVENYVTLFFGSNPICRYDEADRSNIIIDNWSFTPLKTAAKEPVNWCEKPQTALRVLVSNYSAPGHWVWDCMAGSMSMTIAALSMGRNVFAFDKDRSQVIPACKRILKNFANSITSTNLSEDCNVESRVQECTEINDLMESKCVNLKISLKHLKEAPIEDAFRHRIKNDSQIKRMKMLARKHGRVGEQVWQAIGINEQEFLEELQEESDASAEVSGSDEESSVNDDDEEQQSEVEDTNTPTDESMDVETSPTIQQPAASEQQEEQEEPSPSDQQEPPAPSSPPAQMDPAVVTEEVSIPETPAVEPSSSASPEPEDVEEKENVSTASQTSSSQAPKKRPKTLGPTNQLKLRKIKRT